MRRFLVFLLLFLLADSYLSAAPLYFRTTGRAATCLSPGSGSKEIRDFYKSKLSPEEKTKLAESIADREARSLLRSLECIHKLGLSKEEKEILIQDYKRHLRTKEALFVSFENFMLSDEKTIRLSAFEEKSLTSFLTAKKELSARLSQAELSSLTDKPLPLGSFSNTYLAILFQHWEFYQTSPDFLKEGLLD
ncbi:hypothetical protein [Leptospira wolffii]|uniref:hypothetical protein n=1 Tax=Leptospira wolffii TaxID=409998 RepID=UPI0002D948AD|nr:hypothetical protein [Leptospira wolffii]EPG65018.1 hypothetical protein LEP1GSC061_2565 [Leptospira wolffii serovar Khorat str. Khorat-H2]